MSLPELYLSKPGVTFPGKSIDNDEIIRRVRANFKGTDKEFARVASGIEHVFAHCKSKQRYLEVDDSSRVADHSVKAAQQCLELNGASIEEVDLVISGSIARQYFEPATAMEVAAKLGIKRAHAFDVTAACVGHLESIHAAAAYLQLHPQYRTALICTSEVSRHFVSYDVQTVRELNMKAAGLTVGNAAACVLLRSTPFPKGGIRLLSMDSYAAPSHWRLCQAPIDGTLSSSSVELMRLGKLVPPWVRERLAAIGLKPTDIDHYVFHQPSELVIRQIISDIGVDSNRGIYTHSLYGNTASASVAVAYQHLLETRGVRPGEKLALGSAAAGFAMVFMAGEWTGEASQATHA